ncbi:MAG: RNA polymerase sigma factor SigZ [bacterium]|nr:RNA polymerase sigma factor SigZ [bacterium]
MSGTNQTLTAETTMTPNIEPIWKEYHNKLHGFILRRVSDAYAAEDILQDVFIRVYSHLDSLREDNKLQNWIYRITRNAIFDHYRSVKKIEQLPESISAGETGEADLIREEVSGFIIPMIRRLPERYRQAVMMAEVEGLTQKEIAVKLGLTLSGAKTRIQRGRAMVRKMLTDCCRFEFDQQGNVIGYEPRKKNCQTKTNNKDNCNSC